MIAKEMFEFVVRRQGNHLKINSFPVLFSRPRIISLNQTTRLTETFGNNSNVSGNVKLR